MIKHIVFWRLKDDAKAENAERIKQVAEALKDKIPEIVSIEIGINIDESDAAWDVALYSEFATPEDLAAYQVHPDHLELGKMIAEVRTDRAVVDYEV